MSIDGLQRRSSRNQTASIKPKQQVVTPRQTTRLTSAPRRKVIEKEIKEPTLKKARMSAQQKAAQDFFAEVQDKNATDLIEDPKIFDIEDNQPKRRKKRNKKSKERRRKKKIIKIIALILLAVLLSGAIWAYFFANDLVNKVTDDGNLWDMLMADPATPLKKDEYGRTNVLIFGTEGYSMDDPNWDGGHLTDSMMMISLDQESGDMKAISLPRDLKVERRCTGTGKLNEVYWCKYSQNPDKGNYEKIKEYEKLAGEDLEASFEEILGIEIQYRAHLNWQAMIQVIDAIGGIDVVFTYGDQTWDGPETQIKTTDKRGLADGWHWDKNLGKKTYWVQHPNGQVVHLNGEQALGVARARNAHGGYGASGGNFSRELFQQKIIEATMRKVKTMNLDLAKVMSLKNAIGDNIRSNVQDTEIKTILKLSQSLDFANIESLSLVAPKDGTSPLMTTGTINGISYVLPSAGVNNYNQIHKYIAKKLSNSFEAEGASLVVLNATDANGIAGAEKAKLEEQGFIVDKAANAPVSEKGFDGIKIYQRNPEMKKTAEELKKIYKINPNQEIPEALNAIDGDFIILLGNGFATEAE